MQRYFLSPVKAFQRKLLDAINNAGSYSKILVGFISVLLFTVGFLLATLWNVRENTLLRGSACAAAMDNIGGVDASGRLCHEPIDVVYTWVNGSDMEWFKLMRRYRRAWDLEHGLAPPIPSLSHGPMGEGGTGSGLLEGWNSTLWGALWNCTSQEGMAPFNCSSGSSEASYLCLPTPSPYPYPSCTPLNMTGLYWQAVAGQGDSLGPDDIASLNRYRDNDELRYSIRSLFKYSPWIRHIILVTNGQVPAWLDTSHPRVRIVTHEEIYANKSHLPVFSSPSIEVHLHRIPGLSSRFIYFNDDVLLGSDTWPDDYGAPQHGWGAPGPGSAHGQRVFLAWEVPKCNTGCIDSWIGDGYCDAACNVSRCGWDAGDCVNGTKSRGGGTTTTTTYSKGGKYDHYKGGDSGSGSSSSSTGTSSSSPAPPPPPPPCAYGCHDGWIGDRVCDEACKVAACGWDAGDCGVDSLLEHPVSTVAVGRVVEPAVREVLAQAWQGWEDAQRQGNSTVGTAQGNATALKAVLLAALQAQLRVFSTSYAPVLAPLAGRTHPQAPTATCAHALAPPWLPVGREDALILLNVSDLSHAVGLAMERTVSSLHSAQSCLGLALAEVEGGSDGASRQAVLSCVEGQKQGGEGRPPAQYDLVASEVGKSSLVRTGSVIPSAGLVSLVLLPLPKGRGPSCGGGSGNITGGNETEAAAPADSGLPCGYEALEPLHVYLRLRAPLHPPPASTHSNGTLGTGSNHTQAVVKVYAEEVEVHVTLHPVLCPLAAQQQQEEGGAAGAGSGQNETMVMTNRTRSTGGGPHARRRLAQEGGQDMLPIPSAAEEPARVRLSMLDPRAGEPPSAALLSRWAAEGDLRRLLPSPLLTSLGGRRLTQHGASSSPSLHDEDSAAYRRLLHTAWSALLAEAAPHLQVQGQGRARRLADTYADSLITTNKLITARFGKRTRKVPAHMPHLIDTRVMSAVQAAWPTEFEATSARRFRDGDDIQYAFMYMWFILEGGARRGLDVALYFARELDTDGDGVLSPNELRTLAAVVHKRSPTQAEVDALRECMAPSVRNSTVRAVDSPQGVTHEVFTLVHLPHVTWDRLSTCPAVVEGLAKHARFGPTGVEVPNSEEVAFEMVSDDYNKTRGQLDSIRARRPKWVCVNDDMKTAPREVQALLKDFYTAFFPLPSPVELPPGHLNPVLYIGPLRAYRAKETLHRTLAQLLLALVGAAWLGQCWRNRRVGGKGAPQDGEATPAPSTRKAPGGSLGRLLSSFPSASVLMTGRRGLNQRLLQEAGRVQGRPEGSPALHPRSLQGELLAGDEAGPGHGLGSSSGAGAMPTPPPPPTVQRDRARAGSKAAR